MMEIGNFFKISIEVDKLHKFFAALGLVLLIGGAGGIYYVHNTSKETLFKYYLERDTLLVQGPQTEEEGTKLYNIAMQINLIHQDDKSFFNVLMTSVVVGGFGFMPYGLYKWYKEDRKKRRLKHSGKK